MQAIVNKTLVEYSDTGSGPVLLCLHGWMMDRASFAELAKQLAPQMRVIAVDLPNFGNSQQTKAIQTIEQYAQFVADFTQKLELESYVLAGHSMGGQIAIYGVGKQLLSPKALILMSAAGVRDERKMAKLFMGIVAKVFGRVVPVSIKRRLYALIGSDYQPGLSAIHKQIIKHVLNTDVQQVAESITIPTLLLYGSLDASTPVRMGRKLASRIVDSKLVVIEGEQHWSPQTSPKEVAKHITEFLHT